MKGNGKTSWRYLNTDINTEGTFEEDEEWAVRIQGRGETGSKLYVDDISISPGPCPPPGSCDFEDGLGCGWIQDTHDDLDWLVLQADSLANLGGPIYDHSHMAFDGNLNRDQSYFCHNIISIRAGYFALVNANGKQGKKAKLLSPMFMKSDKTFCVHFWFSASGPNIGTLSVWRAKVSDISKRKNLWQYVANQDNPVSDAWTEAQVQYVVG